MSHRTTVPDAVATVVVVGGPDELVAAVTSAAGLAAGARVVSADLASAATLVATHRPFAIVMSDDIYAFDSDEFEALARDVGALLLRVDPAADRLRLERTLMPKLGRAHRRR